MVQTFRTPVAQTGAFRLRLCRQARGPVRQVQAGASNGVATVVANKACSLDESVRLITLSIHEDVEFIEGLKIGRKPSQPRWVDSYKVPGQVVDVTPQGGKPVTTVVASSPYATKAASANIDATLIEIIAATGGKAECLMASAPGDQVNVSCVRGSGFSNIISPEVSLVSALEEKRPVVMLACGADGMAPMRSALEWAPLQAHVSEAPIVLCYVADSMASAAFLPDWDVWRGMGIIVLPLFLHPNGSKPPSSDNGAPAGAPSVASVSLDAPEALDSLSDTDRMIMLFQEALFTPDKRWQELTGGKARDAVVLMSGLPKPVSAALVRFLANHRVPRDRILLS